MQSFTFHNPTKIIFGNNKSDQLAENAKTLGKKALFVYGQNSIKNSGLYDKLINQFKEQKINFIEHGGVKANPTLEHAREGVKKAEKNKIDYIIAVGGGSVIDEAKAIAASVASKQDIWDFFTSKEPITSALPIITLLTLPATGSEMNGNMVITDTQTKEKLGMGDPHLYPKISILDPTLTYSITKEYTAYSAVDMVSHLTESYFTNHGGWTPIQQRYVEGMVKTIIEATEKVLNNPQDPEGRSVMMWSATLAWNGLNTIGLGPFSMPCHTLEHPISAIYDIAHGAGLSIVTPAWLEMNLGEIAERIAHFSREVFGINNDNDMETAKAGINALKDWYIKIGAPTNFASAGIYDPNIKKLTELTLKAADLRKVPNLSEDFVEELFNKCV